MKEHAHTKWLLPRGLLFIIVALIYSCRADEDQTISDFNYDLIPGTYSGSVSYQVGSSYILNESDFIVKVTHLYDEFYEIDLGSRLKDLPKFQFKIYDLNTEEDHGFCKIALVNNFDFELSGWAYNNISYYNSDEYIGFQEGPVGLTMHINSLNKSEDLKTIHIEVSQGLN